MRRARGSSASPAAVSVMLPRARLNSGAPSSASSVLICLDRDGCATRRDSAACVKCLTSATATKYESCCSCTFHSLRLSKRASLCLGRTNGTGHTVRNVSPRSTTVTAPRHAPAPAALPRRLYGSSVGKKAVMAVTGAILVLYLVVHMIGNLKIFL